MTVPEKKSKRRTSKFALLVNTLAAWAVAGYATMQGQAEIGVAALGLVGALFGAYVGVGHLDLRALRAITGKGDAS
ncbi:hypothetical protein [Microvirga calopogonii]|uniref:hypothetical protein n=1 Tax=Microvirga calopogonii TaxID=2078013 RepID=UPI000E0DF0E4|nr:hypothetical protein [Microvirga calopogonii]